MSLYTFVYLGQESLIYFVSHLPPTSKLIPASICTYALLTHANHDKSTMWISMVSDDEITFNLLVI